MNKPNSQNNREDNSESAASLSTVNRIRTLAFGQPFGVLCTQADNSPYGSLVAVSFSEDLCHFVFATSRNTRKYNILNKCQNVALLVDSRVDHPSEMMKVEAFTVIGEAEEITAEDRRRIWAELLLSRHRQLEDFIQSSSTALFTVSVNRFYLVSSFQEVREWSPPD